MTSAGNILIDSNGAVKLADFGVSACMFDTGDRQRARNTFVGTPCWMAPEVMQQLHGYDFKADIWSFGITALELAHGHAPFSKYPPMKVLLMTLQNAPPGLDYERDKRFSKSFKEMVAACLVKDPKKRPIPEKLLKHNFFNHARSIDYLARTILDGLSPLGERFKMLKAKEASLLVQNKALYGDKEQLSQQEYIRGISEWNFNLEDLKKQAALDNDPVSTAEEPGLGEHKKDGHINAEHPVECPDWANHPSDDDGFNDLHGLEISLASFPIKPLQALRRCFDVGEDDVDASSPNWKTTQINSGQQVPTKPLAVATAQDSERNEGDSFQQNSSLPNQIINEHKRFLSGPLIQDNAASPKKISGDEIRDMAQPKYSSERNYSGPLLYRQKKDTNNISSEDMSDGAIVQCKGRFKVTSADLSPKVSANSCFDPFCGGSSCLSTSNITSTSVIPSLQCILQQNIAQRDEILKLMKYVEQTSGKQVESAEATSPDLLQIFPTSAKERELQAQVISLQQSIGSLVEELRRQKLKNAQLERKLSILSTRKENEA